MQVEYKRASDGSLNVFVFFEDMFKFYQLKVFSSSWWSAAKQCVIQESSKPFDIFSDRKESIKVDVQRMSLKQLDSLISDGQMSALHLDAYLNNEKKNFLLVVLIIPPTSSSVSVYTSRSEKSKEYSIKSYVICSEYVFKQIEHDHNYYTRHILCRALSTSCLRWFMPSQTFKLHYEKAKKMDESDSSSILKYLVAFLAVSAVGYGVYRQFGTTQTTQQRLCKFGDDSSKCVNPASVCPADDTSPFCNSWNTYKCTSTQSDECDTLFKSYKPPPLPVPKETAKKVDDETCQGEECTPAPQPPKESEAQPKVSLLKKSNVQPKVSLPKESTALQKEANVQPKVSLPKESTALQKEANVQSEKELSTEKESTIIMQPSSNLNRLDTKTSAFLKEFARFLQYVRSQTRQMNKLVTTDQTRQRNKLVTTDQTDESGYELVTTDQTDESGYELVTTDQTNESGYELVTTDQTKLLKPTSRLIRLCKNKNKGCIYHVRDAVAVDQVNRLLGSLQKLDNFQINNTVNALMKLMEKNPDFTFAQLADFFDSQLLAIAEAGDSVDPLFQNLASKEYIDSYNKTQPKKEKERNEMILKAKKQYIIEKGVDVWGEIKVDILKHMTLDEKIDLLNTLNKRPLKDVMFRLRGYKNSENLFAFEMVDCGHYRAVEALLTGKSVEDIMTLIEMQVTSISCKINWWFSTTRYTTVKQPSSEYRDKYRYRASMMGLPTPNVVQIDSFDNILEKIAKLYNRYDRETAEPDKSNWKMYYFLLDKNDWKFGTISSKLPHPEVLQYNDLPRFQGNALEKKQMVAVQAIQPSVQKETFFKPTQFSEQEQQKQIESK